MSQLGLKNTNDANAYKFHLGYNEVKYNGLPSICDRDRIIPMVDEHTRTTYGTMTIAIRYDPCMAGQGYENAWSICAAHSWNGDK